MCKNIIIGFWNYIKKGGKCTIFILLCHVIVLNKLNSFMFQTVVVKFQQPEVGVFF